jgi:hypothetical protein
MAQRDEILQLFNRIKTQHNTCRLLNVYKGVPMNYEAEVLEVGRRSIVLQTDKHQIVCLYRDRETFVQSDGFPLVVKAKVSDIDFPTVRAELTDFHYVDSFGIGDRTSVRVQPLDPLEVVVKSVHSGIRIRGEVSDISVGGVAVFIDRLIFPSSVFNVGSEISVEINVPGIQKRPKRASSAPAQTSVIPNRYSGLHSNPVLSQSGSEKMSLSRHKDINPDLAIKGIITNSTVDYFNGRYRVGIRLMASDSNSRNVLSQFVSKRQSEIIREVRDMYNSLVTIQRGSK